MSLLELSRVSAGYDGNKVLFDIDLRVEAGSVVALLGPNGAGKSTLLKVATRLLGTSQGSVHLNAKDITRARAHDVAKMGVCYVPEGRGLFRNLSVIENLLIFGNTRNKDWVKQKALDAFPQLAPLFDRTAGTLSGGQQQMLALVRCYLNDPQLILLDEVSMGLAPLVVEEIFNFLPALAARGAGVLLVEQYVPRALALADSVYVLRKGQIVHESASAEGLDGTMLFEKYLGA